VSASAGLTKLAIAGGAGLLGALVIAAVDPPQTRRELFMQALVAGGGSMSFGPIAVHVAQHYISWVDFSLIEYAVPVYFLVGALSWGAAGALAMARKTIREKGADYLIKKLKP
jgi:hypothetical protein